MPPKDTKPSFAGRNVIVTGANVGLGLEAAVKFVTGGAKKVILAVRSLDKGAKAKTDIEARTGRKNVVEVWPLDMLNYTSIKAFAARATNELEHLDFAVLNAGIIAGSHSLSTYGWEKTMQVNVISTTYLALLLMPKLKASFTPDFTPVLEIVGSANHFLTKPKAEAWKSPLGTYNGPKGYSGPSQYSLSKLYVMYAEKHLADMALSPKTGKPDVYVVVVDPGPTQSNIARDYSGGLWNIVKYLFKILLQRTTEEGARTYISGVTLGEKGHGRYWQDDELPG